MKTLALLTVLISSLAAAAECSPLPDDLVGKPRAAVLKRFPQLQEVGPGLTGSGFQFLCLPADLTVEFDGDGNVDTLVAGFTEMGSPKEAEMWKPLAKQLSALYGPSKGVKKGPQYSEENFRGHGHTVVKLMGLGPTAPLQVVVQRGR